MILLALLQFCITLTCLSFIGDKSAAFGLSFTIGLFLLWIEKLAQPKE
jgi:predicted benzoate:H+ symporter BenE